MILVATGKNEVKINDEQPIEIIGVANLVVSL